MTKVQTFFHDEATEEKAKNCRGVISVAKVTRKKPAYTWEGSLTGSLTVGIQTWYKAEFNVTVGTKFSKSWGGEETTQEFSASPCYYYFVWRKNVEYTSYWTEKVIHKIVVHCSDCMHIVKVKEFDTGSRIPQSKAIKTDTLHEPPGGATYCP